MRKIIVGYDGSEQSDRALQRAADLTDGDVSLIVVSAARYAPLTHDPVLGPSAVDPIESEWARGNLDKARARLEGKGVEVRTVEGHGDPADALVRQAKDEEADLIVVGTRGMNAARRAVLGSVSTKVVHHAPCDVLIIR